MATSCRKKIKNVQPEYDSFPDDILNAIVFFRTQRLPTEKQVLIEVNAVDSPHRFFFNYLGPQYQSVFMKTMDEIQFDYRSTSKVYAIPKDRLRMGMACVVKYSSVFFRGVCIDVNDDFVEVFTIDYGKKVVTVMESYDSQPLFWLRRKFKNMPCQAIPGQLHTIFPTGLNWTQESADFLLEKLADHEIYAEIARHELPGETVPMLLNDPTTGDPLDQCLVSAGHAVYVGEKGLEMVDNEYIAQKIYEHQQGLKREAEEAKVETKKPEVAKPVSLSDRLSDRSVKEKVKPVTFDNMLEALEHSSASSMTSDSSLSDCSSTEEDEEEEHFISTSIEVQLSSPVASLPLSDGEEVASPELPTALVRPSVRSIPSQIAQCEKESEDRDVRIEVVSEVEAESLGRSASPSTSVIERLLNIDTSKIECPEERARLRKELQREMESLRSKMEQLDLEIHSSQAAAQSLEDSDTPSSRLSSFNPDAEPFVPRNFSTTPSIDNQIGVQPLPAVHSGRQSLPATLATSMPRHQSTPMTPCRASDIGTPMANHQLNPLMGNQTTPSIPIPSNTGMMMGIRPPNLSVPPPKVDAEVLSQRSAPVSYADTLSSSHQNTPSAPFLPSFSPPMPPPGYVVMPPPGFSDMRPVYYSPAPSIRPPTNFVNWVPPFFPSC